MQIVRQRQAMWLTGEWNAEDENENYRGNLLFQLEWGAMTASDRVGRAKLLIVLCFARCLECLHALAAMILFVLICN